MAIQGRRGNIADFDPSKMVTGEWAFPSDGTARYCVAPGNVKTVATKEDLQGILDATPEAYAALQQLIADLGDTSLSAKLLNDISGINSQLAQKVTQGGLDIQRDMNKNLSKIDQTMLTDTLLQQIAGTAPINAIPADDSLTTRQYVKNSITQQKINKYVANLFTTSNLTADTIVNATGVIVQNATGFSLSEPIPVDELTKYQGYFKDDIGGTLARPGGCYNSNNVWIAEIVYAETVGTNERTFITPDNCAYIRINLTTAELANVYVKEVNKKALEWLEVQSSNLNLSKDTITQDLISGTLIDLIDKKKLTTGAFINATGGLSNTVLYSYSDYIPVVALTQYRGYFKDDVGGILVHAGGCYDANKTWMSEIVYDTQDLTTFESTFTIPSGCEYIRVNILNSEINKAYIKGGKALEWLSITLTNLAEDIRKLIGLPSAKIAFLGDSITYGAGTTKTYHQQIAEETGWTCLNYGIGGTGFCMSSENNTNNDNFNLRYNQIDSDVDCIVVFGGTNDYGNMGGVPLGNPTDNTTATFYGGVNLLIKNLYNAYPNAKLLFITPLRRNLVFNPSFPETVIHSGSGDITNLNGFTLSQYVNIIKERCADCSVPVLDLYTESEMPVDLIPLINTLFSYDGLHPNALGHTTKIAPKVKNTLKTILG